MKLHQQALTKNSFEDRHCCFLEVLEIVNAGPVVAAGGGVEVLGIAISASFRDRDVKGLGSVSSCPKNAQDINTTNAPHSRSILHYSALSAGAPPA
jgi:hypothetical protein